MAIKNAGDAQSLIDTAEGAHAEVTNILQRMRELAVQSASDTNTATDRAALNDEVNQLVMEIDRISSQTTWGGMNLLDGTYASKTFQLGTFANETVGVSIDSIASASLGSFTVDGTTHHKIGTDVSSSVDARTTASLTINGPTLSGTASFSAEDSAKKVAEAVNKASATTGVTAKARTNLVLDTVSATGTYTFDLTGTGTASISTNITNQSDLRGMRDAVNAVAGTTGITASMYNGDNSRLMLTSATGEDIKILNLANAASSDQTFKAFTTDYDGVVSGSGTVFGDTATAGDSLIVSGEVRFTSAGAFSVVDGGTSGANTGYMASGTTSASATTISSVKIGTQANANAAIDIIDGALNKIADQRANLGAISNRLDHTVSNLGNVVINTEASKSRIEDADFAKVTGDLTKSQIMSQAATAMLAQANASKQGVLSLLQG